MQHGGLWRSGLDDELKKKKKKKRLGQLRSGTGFPKEDCKTRLLHTSGPRKLIAERLGQG
jgi:hypothetical protein